MKNARKTIPGSAVLTMPRNLGVGPDFVQHKTNVNRKRRRELIKQFGIRQFKRNARGVTV